MLKKITFALILIMAAACFAAADDDAITYVTYYPAPYGVYHEMRAEQLSVGHAYLNKTLSDGNLIVSGNVGIGTDNPTEKLVVDGTVKVNKLDVTEICLNGDCRTAWSVSKTVNGTFTCPAGCTPKEYRTLVGGRDPYVESLKSCDGCTTTSHDWSPTGNYLEYCYAPCRNYVGQTWSDVGQSVPEVKCTCPN